MTKSDCTHYSGRIWLKGEIGGRGNVYAEITGSKELFLICYLPKITDEGIKNWIKATGWNPEQWL